MNESSVLALECSSWRASVALSHGAIRLAKTAANPEDKNSDVMLPMAKTLMSEAHLEFQALSAIAFGAGPGAFTGLRVACGLAQGLAFGAGCPVIPVSSLECLAEGLHRTSPVGLGTRVLTALDARMGEIYLAIYTRRECAWQLEHAPMLTHPEHLAANPPLFDVGVGDGFTLEGMSLFQGRWQSAAPQVPEALDLLTLALPKLAAGEAVAPEAAELLYVRDKVALTTVERESRRG